MGNYDLCYSCAHYRYIDEAAYCQYYRVYCRNLKRECRAFFMRGA